MTDEGWEEIVRAARDGVRHVAGLQPTDDIGQPVHVSAGAELGHVTMGLLMIAYREIEKLKIRAARLEAIDDACAVLHDAGLLTAEQYLELVKGVKSAREAPKG